MENKSIKNEKNINKIIFPFKNPIKLEKFPKLSKIYVNSEKKEKNVIIIFHLKNSYNIFNINNRLLTVHLEKKRKIL